MFTNYTNVDPKYEIRDFTGGLNQLSSYVTHSEGGPCGHYVCTYYYKLSVDPKKALVSV